MRVHAPAPVSVLTEQSSDEMPCQRRGLRVPQQRDAVDVVLVNNALPKHHNSQYSRKQLADPNGNVISQIKDGPALMKSGVMGCV